MTGPFITFEGIEGSGKTTQIERLSQRLLNAGREVLVLREPGGTVIGEQIRELVKFPPNDAVMTPETELLLINASRAQLVREVIRPALASGHVVLCDRFFHSTIAYQGYGRGLDLEAVNHVIGLAVEKTRPDLTVFLDIPYSVSESRIQARQEVEANGPDQFEQASQKFFDQVREGFKFMAAQEPDRICQLDADKPANELAEDIWGIIAPLL